MMLDRARFRMKSMVCMMPLDDDSSHAACPGDVCECECHDRTEAGRVWLAEHDTTTKD